MLERTKNRGRCSTWVITSEKHSLIPGSLRGERRLNRVLGKGLARALGVAEHQPPLPSLAQGMLAPISSSLQVLVRTPASSTSWEKGVERGNIWACCRAVGRTDAKQNK